MKKKTYIKPSIDITLLHTDRILTAVSNTSGSDPNGNKTDAPGYGGEGSGEDMAKDHNAWSSWDE